jgi:uncharacterized membrane protein
MTAITVKERQPVDWRQVALPSLLLNLFLVALIGGYLLRDGSPGGGLALRFPLGRSLTNVEAVLSPSDAAALRQALAQEAPRYRAAAQKLNTARIELAHQISAERIDRDATRRAFVEWRVSWDNFIQALTDPLTDSLTQVSPDGRRKLVLAAEHHRSRQIGPVIP